MKAIILNSLGRALCMIFVICISVAGYPYPHPGDDVLQVTKNGLEATLKIESCGDNSILTIEWKNTNAEIAIVALSLKSKSDQSVFLTTSVVIGANEVKSETCESLNPSYRAVSISDFTNVQAELTIAN
jgi:hypothetical protein